MRKGLLGLVLALWLAPAAVGAPTTRILYASDWSGHMEIYAVGPSGKAPPGQITFGSDSKCGTFLPCGFVDPILSPNGRQLLYRGSASGSLWVAQADGSGAHLLASPLSGEAAWSPNSRRVAYSTADGVHVVDADGRNDRTVAAGLEGDVGWAHDGRSLFVLDSTGRLYLVRGATRRVLGRSEGAHMAVSRDGRWIATTFPGTAQPVRVIHVGAHRVTQTEAGLGTSVAWSDDSRRLAIEGPDGIRVFDVWTDETRWLKRNVGFDVFGEAPEGLGMAWAPDGRSLAYIVGSVDPQVFGGVVNGNLTLVTLAGKTRTVVAEARSYGGRMISVAWARTPARRYRRPEPEPAQRVTSDSALADGPIAKLAADGTHVAFVTCNEVFVWTPSAQTVELAEQAIGPPTFCFYRINYEVYDVALADDRLVYATSDGCNSIQIALHLEKLSPPPTANEIPIESGLGNCGAPFHPAFGELAASGGLLVYGKWWETSDIPVLPPFTTTREEIHRVDGEGCPCPVIASTPGPLFVADVDQDRVVAYGTNATLLLDRDGHELLSLAVSPLAAQLAGPDLVLLLHGQLRDYDARSGDLLHTWPLPEVASGPECAWRTCSDERLVLHDAAQGLVVYTLDGQVHLLRLADGADMPFAAGTTACFTDIGLVYADGARIRLVPFGRLPLRAF
jgi:hypothetical protein